MVEYIKSFLTALLPANTMTMPGPYACHFVLHPASWSTSPCVSSQLKSQSSSRWAGHAIHIQLLLPRYCSRQLGHVQQAKPLQPQQCVVCSQLLTSRPDMVKCLVSPRTFRMCSVLTP